MTHLLMLFFVSKTPVCVNCERARVPVVCDDVGYVGGDVGGVVTLVAWRVPLVPVPSASLLLCTFLWQCTGMVRYGTVCRGPNHGVQSWFLTCTGL